MTHKDVEISFAEQKRIERLVVIGIAIGCLIGSVVLAYWRPMV